MGKNQLIHIQQLNSTTIKQFNNNIISLRAAGKGIFVDGSMQLAALVDGELVGCIDLYNYDPIHRRAEVGIGVERSCRRKGYATAMLLELDKLCAHQLHLHQLYCDVVTSNTVSCHLFERCGYRQVGVCKNGLWSTTNTATSSASKKFSMVISG